MNALRILVAIIMCGLIGVGVYWMSGQESEGGYRIPVPTDGVVAEFQGEDEGHADRRREWIELMHRSDRGVDWRQVEMENAFRRHQVRRGLAVRGGGDEVFANGHLAGEWKELGSTDQAGSVINTLYDAANDEIYLISAGGSLWKGKRDGSEWTVVNQDLRFNEGVLEWIPKAGGRRMVAFIGRIPHYSDDDGQTWTAATGISYTDSWGAFHSPVVVADSGIIYVLAKKDYWSNIRLYRSADYGETYQWFGTMTTSNFDNYRMFSPQGSDEVFLLQRSSVDTRVYQIDHSQPALALLNKDETLTLGEARANLAGYVTDSVPTLFIYRQTPGENPGLYVSTNLGATWEKRGELPARPWGVGVYVTPSNPDVMFLGEVECYRSDDGGANWVRINQWWEYYDAPATMLHADMMHFAEFETANGNPFLLVSNHGGLSISENGGISMENIALSGLNVSQYYSLKSSPAAPYLFFGGSQDQGFQRGVTLGEGPFQMKQLISGDYGHIAFSKGGNRLWTVYPGGWVIVYDKLTDNGHSASWEMNSLNESVWIPPLHETGNPQEDAILMAGGHIDGSEGSHLVRLTYQSGSKQVTASQLDFDFRDASGGEVSAIEVSPFDSDHLYTATTNGRFFRSLDGGENWDQAVNFIPSGHYLYGQTILASPTVEGQIYLGGSGYDAPPVWVSEDNGETFVPMSDGLPSTLVFEMCADPDGQFLFAATEAGPFVYVIAEQNWFDLTGMAAPAQTYWSVQYIEGQSGGPDRVRFGTYGRGGWDLEIGDLTVKTETPVALTDGGWTAFPNPANEKTTLQYSGSNNHMVTHYEVIDRQGQRLFGSAVNTEVIGLTEIFLGDIPAGWYGIRLVNASGESVAVVPIIRR